VKHKKLLVDNYGATHHMFEVFAFELDLYPTNLWPPNSCTINPVDYRIWSNADTFIRNQ